MRYQRRRESETLLEHKDRGLVGSVIINGEVARNDAPIEVRLSRPGSNAQNDPVKTAGKPHSPLSKGVSIQLGRTPLFSPPLRRRGFGGRGEAIDETLITTRTNIYDCCCIAVPRPYAELGRQNRRDHNAEPKFPDI